MGPGSTRSVCSRCVEFQLRRRIRPSQEQYGRLGLFHVDSQRSAPVDTGSIGMSWPTVFIAYVHEPRAKLAWDDMAEEP